MGQPVKLAITIFVEYVQEQLKPNALPAKMELLTMEISTVSGPVLLLLRRSRAMVSHTYVNRNVQLISFGFTIKVVQRTVTILLMPLMSQTISESALILAIIMI